MKNLRTAVLISSLLIGATAQASQDNLKDFDVAPFTAYSNLKTGDLKTQTIATDAGNISILRTSEFKPEQATVVFYS